MVTTSDLGTATSTITRVANHTRRIPGELGVWIFLLADFSFFASIFGTFMYYRGRQPEIFDAGRAALNSAWGMGNTVILLTASLSMAFAVRHVRHADLIKGRRWLTISGGFGVWFVVNKAFEWTAEVDAGHKLTENNFFVMYYMAAGVHMLHVLMGLGVISYLYFAITRDMRQFSGPTPMLKQNVESGGVYWHFVDLIWVILFALLYLVV